MKIKIYINYFIFDEIMLIFYISQILNINSFGGVVWAGEGGCDYNGVCARKFD